MFIIVTLTIIFLLIAVNDDERKKHAARANYLRLERSRQQAINIANSSSETDLFDGTKLR